MKINASEFWEKYKESDNTRIHICDVPEEVFYARHKHTLSLIKDKGYDPIKIGLLIAGRYYSHVWGSRSCSRYLSYLVGRNDYMDFYCGGSIYYFLIGNPFGLKEIGLENKLVTAFKEADLKDQEYSILK